VAATVPLSNDLEEMGLPAGLTAVVLSNNPCPPLSEGAGRVVLTTINHLNSDVWQLDVVDEAGQDQTIRTTGWHKFYSAQRNEWISAKELEPGEQLNGVSGTVYVRSLERLPGVQRVYNMTVEDEHVYRVSSLGVLVHNEDCKIGSTRHVELD